MSALKLDSFNYSEATVSKEYEGYLALLGAIMEQAFLDLKHHNSLIRNQAISFFKSPSSRDVEKRKYFQWLCSMLNLDPQSIEKRVESVISN